LNDTNHGKRQPDLSLAQAQALSPEQGQDLVLRPVAHEEDAEGYHGNQEKIDVSQQNPQPP